MCTFSVLVLCVAFVSALPGGHFSDGTTSNSVGSRSDGPAQAGGPDPKNIYFKKETPVVGSTDITARQPSSPKIDLDDLALSSDKCVPPFANIR